MTEYFALAIAVSFPLICIWTARHPSDVSGGADLRRVRLRRWIPPIVYRRTKSFGRDVCIDSVGVFFGIIVVRIIGWTGRKTVFKEKVKQKKPKKKLFGGKSKTTYYDKYGNYQHHSRMTAITRIQDLDMVMTTVGRIMVMIVAMTAAAGVIITNSRAAIRIMVTITAAAAIVMSAGR